MKNPLISAWIALAFAGAVGMAQAENADRNKPMNIEADSLKYDDLKQVSVFTGRVVLTKGSIQIRGAQIEVRQDPDGFQFGTVTSSRPTLAFYRQKREGLEEYIEGEAEVIEYDGKADTVKFIRRAQLRRLRGTALADEITGGVILYENLTDKFSVDGNASKGAMGVASVPSGRVRAMLTPKETSAPVATPPVAPAAPVTPPANLRPSAILGGAPK